MTVYSWWLLLRFCRIVPVHPSICKGAWWGQEGGCGVGVGVRFAITAIPQGREAGSVMTSLNTAAP